MIQVGMILGFLTPYPVSTFHVKSGWKEKMPQYEHEMKEKMCEEQMQEQKAA